MQQLLGYLTWRDCKAALVIFNKHIRRFSEILSRVPETFSQIDNFLKEEPTNQDGEWRYLISSREDEARHITLHVFLFNLFVDK